MRMISIEIADFEFDIINEEISKAYLDCRSIYNSRNRSYTITLNIEQANALKDILTEYLKTITTYFLEEKAVDYYRFNIITDFAFLLCTELDWLENKEN